MDFNNSAARAYLREQHGLHASLRTMTKWCRNGAVEAVQRGRWWWTSKEALDAAVLARRIPGSPGRPRKHPIPEPVTA